MDDDDEMYISAVNMNINLRLLSKTEFSLVQITHKISENCDCKNIVFYIFLYRVPRKYFRIKMVIL